MSSYVPLGSLFSIGIGPSSSHTVGPMRAANDFIQELAAIDGPAAVERVECSLYGSLGATGIGHGTPGAVVAGLTGADPATCPPQLLQECWQQAQEQGVGVSVAGQKVVVRADDIRLIPETRLAGHSNALRLRASDTHGAVLLELVYYSVGGGFIERADQPPDSHRVPVPDLAYKTGADLLSLCGASGRSIADVARANELASVDDVSLDALLDGIWSAMSACIDAGLAADGTLPGVLRVHRRAKRLARRLEGHSAEGPGSSLGRPDDWLQVFAIAVNEENAAGGRVVTAPTNGAAGIIPAVGRYHLEFTPGACARDIRTYLLTATAIGSLFKTNGSISGAEAGCQGEVGSACSMAAAGICAVWGGSPEQVENAAEIALEHHLGLTCDPVAGLVQIPCIERNAIASGTAVNAARLALNGDGDHRVSLDVAIATMLQTGADMSTKYKETSTGGLALNVPLC